MSNKGTLLFLLTDDGKEGRKQGVKGIRMGKKGWHSILGRIQGNGGEKHERIRRENRKK